MGRRRKADVVLVPPRQLGALRALCQAASAAANRAQQVAAAARLELADGALAGARPSQLELACRLQREAIQRLNLVLFLGQLYVAAFRIEPARGPTLRGEEA